MKRPVARSVPRALALLALAAPLLLGGCDDGFGPTIWGPVPDTAELYSLARVENVDRFGAYDLFSQAGVVVENLRGPFDFDFAITEDEAGEFVLLPTGYFPDASARPGILIDDTASFTGLRRAPREGYVTEEPVPLSTGVIYVVKTRLLGSCTRYGKVEVLDIDEDGIVQIQTLVNPNCGERSLVPNAPEEDDEDEEGEGEA